MVSMVRGNRRTGGKYVRGNRRTGGKYATRQ